MTRRHLSAVGFGIMRALIAHASFLLLPWLLNAELVQAQTVESSEGESLSLTEMLGGDRTEGFARATELRTFRFPEDHGAHEDFRTEWWYFTGNLTTAGGRRFGYQFTLFRNAVAPESQERSSDWARTA